MRFLCMPDRDCSTGSAAAVLSCRITTEGPFSCLSRKASWPLSGCGLQVAIFRESAIGSVPAPGQLAAWLLLGGCQLPGTSGASASLPSCWPPEPCQLGAWHCLRPPASPSAPEHSPDAEGHIAGQCISAFTTCLLTGQCAVLAGCAAAQAAIRACAAPLCTELHSGCTDDSPLGRTDSPQQLQPSADACPG